MTKPPDKKETGYDPVAIQPLYLEAIKNLRARLDQVSSPHEKAKIKSDIAFLQEDMSTLDKVVM